MTTEQAIQFSTEEFVGRLFDSGIKAMELATIYIGDRLGLYRALSENGPTTAGDLARRAGLDERQVREWLEQQAVASILSVDDPRLAEDKRRYALPEEHAAALIDLDSPMSMSPLARTVVTFAQSVPLIVDSFKTGKGVPWQAFGEEAVDIQGDFNRPWLLGQLGTEYLPSVPEAHKRLNASTPARVLDVACGVGWASIAIARAYPNATVHGIDIDETSVKRATQNAVDTGLAGRVKFEARDAASLAAEAPYDFAIVVEAVHDMSNPVGVLSAIRKALAPGASLIVVDERVADSFTAPGDEVERFMYSASVLICLPAGLSEQPSAGTGTVMRSATLRRYAQEAGFSDVEVLNLEHPFLRFYRLS